MKRIEKIAKMHSIAKSPVLTKSASSLDIHEGLDYHIKNKIPLHLNIYRYGSQEYCRLINEARKLWKSGGLIVCDEDMEILASDAGILDNYNGETVLLDTPMADDEHLYLEKSAKKKKQKKKDPPLRKPKRGGSKKFYVHVRCNGKIKKISFGSPDMPLRVSDDDRRKSFVARHKCKTQAAADPCTARYWSCRIGRYPNLTGASKKYKWW
tara:strand:- start:14887 stop:15516 length:630 start_codon:yes stop_codon:yes gene_type:complete